jgi:hypothetical protein
MGEDEAEASHLDRDCANIPLPHGNNNRQPNAILTDEINLNSRRMKGSGEKFTLTTLKNTRINRGIEHCHRQ